MTFRKCLFIVLALWGSSVATYSQKKFTNSDEISVIESDLQLPAPPKTGERWLSGRHYSVLAPAVREKSVGPEKIDVVEFFMYTSPSSAKFQPYVREWLKTKANYIEYRRVPSIVFPHARAQARMYYALEELGRTDLHDMLFEWVARPKHGKIYHNLENPNERGSFKLSREFARVNGIDVRQFSGAYHSQDMERKLLYAEIKLHNYHIFGTSTVCVNGRYCTSVQRLVEPLGRQPQPEDFRKMLRLIDYLVGSEIKTSSLPVEGTSIGKKTT